MSGDGDGWIEVILRGEDLIGVIAGSPNKKKGESPRRDDKNPDPALRDRLLNGMTIMQGFRYVGGNRWTGGKIYDPNSGKTYKGKLTQIDRNTLKLRGYIGISLFGRSATATVVERPTSSAPPRVLSPWWQLARPIRAAKAVALTRPA